MTQIDWSKLTFSYTKTNTILLCKYSDGKWGEIISTSDDNIVLSTFAGALHYGIECFEGLKAFRHKDGKVTLFRPEENAKRMIDSANALCIPAPDVDLFVKMCKQSVRENADFIPPYGTNAALYLRPTLIGVNAQLGVHSSTECLFLMLCAPVGAYTGGTLEPSNAVISRNYDRAAPNGTGCYKLGANYAISLKSLNIAHKLGFRAALYLDPLTKDTIEEYNAANFFAIKGNSYITPKSSSILPSITNKSLEVVAADLGMTVERRPVKVAELAEFDEVGQCGTAVVITPVHKIVDKPFLESEESTVYTFGKPDECGPKSLALYKAMTSMMYGDSPDIHNWNVEVEL